MLDVWIGPEGIPWYRERELRHVLRQHARGGSSEIGKVEATGAINFLQLDDIPVIQEGEPLDPQSILRLPFQDGKPVFPPLTQRLEEGFVRDINRSGRKWVVLVDEQEEPRFVVNAFAFIRGALFGGEQFDPARLCHRPLVIRDARRPLGQVLGQLTVRPERPDDDVVDEDLILVWTGAQRRIITGSDLLGRLLRGIVKTSAG